jgi:hypothetical protein
VTQNDDYMLSVRTNINPKYTSTDNTSTSASCYQYELVLAPHTSTDNTSTYNTIPYIHHKYTSTSASWQYTVGKKLELVVLRRAI